MNNVLRFFTKLCEFCTFGANIRECVGAMKKIYLLDDKEINEYLSIINNEEYRELTSLRQIHVYVNFQVAYGIGNFGKTEKEACLLKAKEEAFKRISAVCEGNYSLEKIAGKTNIPYIKSLMGMAYYYGLFGMTNTEYGRELIAQAADAGDIDAKLWVLSSSPQLAKKILSEIANTPEYTACSEELKAWKDYYKVDQIDIIQRGTVKMGFTC